MLPRFLEPVVSLRKHTTCWSGESLNGEMFEALPLAGWRRSPATMTIMATITTPAMTFAPLRAGIPAFRFGPIGGERATNFSVLLWISRNSDNLVLLEENLYSW